MNTAFKLNALRFTAMTSLLCGLSFALPTLAAPGDDPVLAQNSTHESAPSMLPKHGKHSAEAMARHVEKRIATLHDKLEITTAEEAKWASVAQVMRDNEKTISDLIETRHKSPQDMTAITDLQSYQDITQAHADGIKKLIVVFQDLYNDMPEDQKTVADKIFGQFEGHEHKKSAKHAM